MSLKNITILLISILAITGCQKGLFDESPSDESFHNNLNVEVRENPADKNPPQYSMTYGEFEKSFVAEVVPGDKAFVYDINFKWNPFQIPKKLRIREAKRVVETATNTAYFKYTTNHDQTLIFTFEILNEENNLEHVFTKTVTVPKDFVVDQNNRSLIPSEITEKGHVFRYNRVFLSEEYSLLFDQAVNFIEINHLYTVDKTINVIENVDTQNIPDYRALPEQHGLNGNTLYLVINNLYGRIMIINRGQNGGHGINGQAFTSRAGNGADAKAGQSDFCDPPGVGPGRGFVISNTIERACGCFTNGFPGGSGANGANGKNGTNAGNGGESGSVTVKVNKVYFADKKEIIDSIYSDDLNFVQVKLIKGLKGNKGLGSAGQLGGFGGKEAKGQCAKDATKGSDGSNGIKGSDGLDGVDGALGKQCLAIPVLGVNYCE